MQPKSKQIILVFLVIVSGFIAGLIGELVTRYYLSWKAIPELYLNSGQGLGQKEVVIREAKNVIVEQDLRINQIRDSIKQSYFTVYNKKPLSKSLIESAHLPSEAISQALAVTSDGWLVTFTKAELNKNVIEAVNNENIFPILEIYSDPKLGLKFIKIEAKNLTVTQFAQQQNLSDGQLVINFSDQTATISLSSISKLNYRSIVTRYDLVQNLEDYDQRILIEDKDLPIGSVIMNLDGDIVGWVLESNLAIKSVYGEMLMNGVLKSQQILKPYLGLNFVARFDLAGQAGWNSQGVIVTKDASGVAIKKDSPLAGKILEGDVILGIDDHKITSTQSLQDIIYSYRPDSVANFKLLRGEDELSIPYVVEHR